MDWKRFIELWLCNYKWARKLHGGRWVRRKEIGYEWVTWNDPEDVEMSGWPLRQDEYECETWA